MRGFAHFAASKAGLRMIAQSMAREFGPQAFMLVTSSSMCDRGRPGSVAVPGHLRATRENGALNTNGDRCDLLAATSAASIRLDAGDGRPPVQRKVLRLWH